MINQIVLVACVVWTQMSEGNYQPIWLKGKPVDIKMEPWQVDFTKDMEKKKISFDLNDGVRYISNNRCNVLKTKEVKLEEYLANYKKSKRPGLEAGTAECFADNWTGTFTDCRWNSTRVDYRGAY